MPIDSIIEGVGLLIELAIEVAGELATDQVVTTTRARRERTERERASREPTERELPAATHHTRKLLTHLQPPPPPLIWRALDSRWSYPVIGALLGGASLWLWPERIAHRADARVSLVFITTMVGGGVMAAVGAYRKHRNRPPGRLATFGTGALFALAYAAARALGHWLGV